MRTTITLCLLTTSALCSLPRAQTVVCNVKALTTMTVKSPLASKTVPAKTDLRRGYSLRIDGPQSVVWSHIRVDDALPTGASCRISDSWSVVGGAAARGVYAAGSHATLMTLVTSQTIRGRLVIKALLGGTRGSVASASVDIGGDGSVEAKFTGPFHSEFPLTLTPGKPVVIKTTTGVSADTRSIATPGWGQCVLTIEFRPSLRCDTTSYGQSCAGTDIRAASTFRDDVEVNLSFPARAITGVLLIGVGRRNMRLPTPHCAHLLTDVLIPVRLRMSSRGNTARVRLPVPRSLSIRFNMQGAIAAQRTFPIVMSTPALDTSCR